MRSMAVGQGVSTKLWGAPLRMTLGRTTEETTPSHLERIGFTFNLRTAQIKHSERRDENVEWAGRDGSRL